VRVGSGGKISLFSHSAAHLVADVTGYFTDASAASGSDGLFVPLTPARVFDTREPAPVPGKVPAGATVSLAHGGRAGIPASGAGALALNVTAVDADGAGYVTAYPGGTTKPDTSTLNVVNGDTRPNATIIKIGADGAVSYFSQPGAHLLADVTGYFTGPRASTLRKTRVM
jgi:hypothetical protein